MMIDWFSKNTRNVSKYLNEDIINISLSKSINKIVVGVGIATLLMDDVNFDPLNPINSQPIKINSLSYKIGTIYGIDIFSDPLLNWNDNKILFYLGDELIHTEIANTDLYEDRGINQNRSDNLKKLLED
jgi:hypothetical protein